LCPDGNENGTFIPIWHKKRKMGIKTAFSFPFGWRIALGWVWEGRFGARMVGDQAEWAWESRFGARLTEGRWCGGAVAVFRRFTTAMDARKNADNPRRMPNNTLIARKMHGNPRETAGKAFPARKYTINPRGEHKKKAGHGTWSAFCRKGRAASRRNCRRGRWRGRRRGSQGDCSPRRPSSVGRT